MKFQIAALFRLQLDFSFFFFFFFRKQNLKFFKYDFVGKLFWHRRNLEEKLNLVSKPR